MQAICENICKANGGNNANSPIEIPSRQRLTGKIAIIQSCKQLQTYLGKKISWDNAKSVMASEDFGHFIDKIPGCFAFLGGKREGEEVYPLHHAKFDYNDENLVRGAEFFAEIVRLKLPM